MKTMINWQEFKVRCSAINKVLSNSKDNPVLTEKQAETLSKYREKLDSGGSLTTNQSIELLALKEKEANGKRIILSDTCIEYLMVEYAWITEKMIPVGKESLDLVAIKKGNITEEEAVGLLIRLDKVPYQCCKDRVYSEYLSGELDVYLGDNPMSATMVVDIKNSLDYPTFLKKIHTGIENSHVQQVQGYMDITGAKDGVVAHTLVSCPPEVIEDMKWKLARKMNALTIEGPEFLEEWKTWEHSMNFDHMPVYQRVHKIKIGPFGEFERQRLYDKVKICRDWLYKFHEQYQKMNL